MITLPAGRYLPVGRAPTEVAPDRTDTLLSAGLICISGWDPNETGGARAAGQTSVIRFRTPLPVGAKVNLVLRLAALGGGFSIRIQAESGCETEVAVSAGTEKMGVVACQVAAGQLVTASLSSVSPMLEAAEFDGEPFWVLKGILYFDPIKVATEAASKSKGSPEPVDQSEAFSWGDRLLLRSSARDENHRAPSFDAFLKTPDSHWPISFASYRDAPIFADSADRDLFYSGCGKSSNAPQAGKVDENIRLVRRTNQFVSLSRSSEGSAFDRSGVWRAFGYLHGSPANRAFWMSTQDDALSIDEAALASARYYEGSYLIFYNGLLENYYHWLAEGILSLDILLGALPRASNHKILLPGSMATNAGFDHRHMLRAVGLDGRPIVEVAEDLIRVREAIWVDSDLVASMPAAHLKRFQQRIAALYGGTPRNRRLLVARRGRSRIIHNMEQVETFLSTYGFETVYLEGRSFEDQISMFQSAEFIIAQHGAAMTNLLFCEPGTKVIELMASAELRAFYWFITQKLDLVHGLQFCETVPVHHFDAELVVDIRKLEALIRMVDAHL